MAGIRYIDPLAPVPKVCAQLAGSSVVIAEAMHGAIVADAFRVPWIPAATSGRFNRFKWQDWALSLGMSPAVHPLPRIGAADLLRDVLVGPEETPGPIDTEGLASRLPAARKPLVERARRLYAGIVKKPARSWLEYKLLERFGPDLDAAASRALPAAWNGRLSRAAAALQAVSVEPAYLSSDTAFTTALARVHEKVVELERDLRESQWGPQQAPLRAAGA
jgi:succinoglycan biosynthesis protein ExoV